MASMSRSYRVTANSAVPASETSLEVRKASSSPSAVVPVPEALPVTATYEVTGEVNRQIHGVGSSAPRLSASLVPSPSKSNRVQSRRSKSLQQCCSRYFQCDGSGHSKACGGSIGGDGDILHLECGVMGITLFIRSDGDDGQSCPRV